MSQNRVHNLLAVAVCVLALGGPHAKAAQHHRRSRLCAKDDTRPWAQRRAPANAQSYRDVADTHPYYKGLAHGPRRETWFTLPSGQVMLCRTGDRMFCEAEWWQFRAGAEPITGQGGSLCVPNE